MAKLIEITGKALSGEWGTDDETGCGIPVLRTTNFTNEGIVNYRNVVTRTITKKKIAEKYLRQGDIIIEKSGGSDKQPVGRVIYFDGPDSTYLFNNFTGLLRVKDRNVWYPRYVFYSLFFNYRRGGTKAFENKTTGLHNLKVDDYVSRCEVRVENIQKQVAICEQLDRIFDIIRARQQQLQKLDELIKARFVELFGDGNHPHIALIDLIIEGAGLSYGIVQPGDDGTGDMGVLRPVDMVDGKISTASIKYIDRSIGDGFKKTELYGDELLITVRGTTGITALTDIRFNGMNVTRGIAVVRYDRNKINPVYLNAYLNTDESQRYIQEHTRGATLQQINLSDLRVQQIMVPPLALQEQMAAFIEQTDKSKSVVQKALDEAQLLFDSLMQQYFG
ncbi:restriction endonuclease subunit S [Butyricicoccus sp. AF10-3]|jgi:type I restriction enzyme, S subunit|nr:MULTISPECIES: restriction endonuclease subunit S [unclassified Butyricicoccus]RHQ71229.1 restriction endonuclease subunit S [Butyricicoccus sp. AF24-19AC]RHS38147.1 restriction endonuclease subunit S [Butyricicoccus sp. AF10-3]